jgi:hypothetical protein
VAGPCVATHATRPTARNTVAIVPMSVVVFISRLWMHQASARLLCMGCASLYSKCKRLILDGFVR